MNGGNNNICGDVDGKAVVYERDDLKSNPDIKLTGTVKPDALYTVMLSNPDDYVVAIIGPIIHDFVGNIKGSDFALGDLSKGE